MTSTAPIAYVVHSWISMFLLSKMLRWVSPRLPRELYDCSNGFTFVPYTSLTHALRVTEESIPFVEIDVSTKQNVTLGFTKTST